MARIAIELLLRQMEAAYRLDPFHALRKNLESVTSEEWEIIPVNASVGPDSEFGTQPELSICDLVGHVAGAKHMYANRLFGDASMEWSDLRAPGRDMVTMLAWLDDGYNALAAGVAALDDDAALQMERPAPWRTPMRVEQLVLLMLNHDLYHSGEINRQRALIRGSDGWQR